jgi:hypothetical protein
MDTYLFFALLSGLSWTAVYVLIIRKGFKDKSYGMPIFCLALNISWELIYSLVIPNQGAQRWINLVWFFFDIILIIQVILYWKKDFPDLNWKVFYSLFSLIILTSFLGILTMQLDFSNAEFFHQREHILGMGRAYSAFLMNLIMSILFVVFLYQRKSTRGQSIYIGILKLLGTVFADIPFIITPYVEGANLAHPGTPATGEWMWPYFYAFILIFDLIYIVQFALQAKKEGKNPFKII